MGVLRQLLRIKRSLLIVLAVLVIAIVFETFQQLYFIRTFDLAKNVTFLDVLQGQSYRWLVWMILSVFLIRYAKANAFKKTYSLVDMAKYMTLIVLLVLISVLIISTIQMIRFDSISMAILINDYIPFFTFQKAPIYTLGYIALAFILHLYFANEQLQFKIQELSEIKKTDQKLYHTLRSNIDDKATVLNIKIGNKRKIIPVEEIIWLEADDYCVKVHTRGGESYSMRSSLKAMDEKLDDHFLRIHRKAIVNMTMAKELNISQTPNLTLTNDLKIPISKTNLKLVREYLS